MYQDIKLVCFRRYEYVCILYDLVYKAVCYHLTAKQTNKWCYQWKVRRCLRSKTIM